ncbi:MAG: hypothetical protein ABH857_04775 [Elusimicrobiota bacterium]
MKKIITITLVLTMLINQLVFAVPGKIMFETNLSENGELISGEKKIAVRLYSADDTAKTIWEEVHENVFFSSGTCIMELGKEKNLDSKCFDINDAQFGISIFNGQERGEEAVVPIYSLPYAVQAGGIKGISSDKDDRIGIGETETLEAGLKGKLNLQAKANQAMAYFTGKALRDENNPYGPDPSSYIFMKDLDSEEAWGLRVGNDGDFAVHQVARADRFNITKDGDIGIGLTNPGKKVGINGDILFENGFGVYARNSAGTIGNLIHRNKGDETIIGENIFDNPMILQTGKNLISFATNKEERMRITSDGKVGVGAVSPQARLHVFTKLEQPMAYFEGKDLRSSDNPNGPDPSSYVFLKDLDSAELWGLRVGNDGEFAVHQAGKADRLNITKDGKVGIGVTNPNAKLQISQYDNSNYGVNLELRRDGGHESGLSLHSGGFGAYGIVVTLPDGDLAFIQDRWSCGAGSEKMRLTRAGNLGIGNANPSQKLDVAGTVKAAEFIGDGSKLTGIVSGLWKDIGYGISYSSGSVGIGAILPDTKLHISNNSADILKMQNTLENGGIWQFKVGGGGTFDKNFMIFDKTDGADNRRLTISEKGDVSINANKDALTYLSIYNQDTGINAGAIARLVTAGGHTDIVQYNSGRFSVNNIYPNGYIAFNTSGSERLRITGDGRVGIGVTNPASKMHIRDVHARLQVEDPEGEIAYMEALSANNNVRIGSASKHPVAFSVNNEEKMYLTQNGDLGIGAVSPQARLHVFTKLEQPMAYFEGKDLRSSDNPNGPDPSSYVFLKDLDSAEAWGLRLGDGGEFAIHQVSKADRLNITKDGDIGIGLTNPGKKVGINGDILFENGFGVYARNSVGTIGNLIHRNKGDETIIGENIFDNPMILQTGRNFISFATNKEERMRITSDGKVGIGVENPNAKLDIKGDILLEPVSEEIAYNSLAFHQHTNGDAIVWIPKDGNLRFKSGAAGSLGDKISFTASGRVGIGVNDPQSQLSILCHPTYKPFTIPHHGEFGGGTNTRLSLLGLEPGFIISSDLSYLGGTPVQTGTETHFLGMQIGHFTDNDSPRNQIFFGGGNLDFVRSEAGTGSNYKKLMTLTDSGLLGIGKSNPAATLDVMGTINAEKIMINGVPLTTSAQTVVGNAWIQKIGGKIYYPGQVTIEGQSVPYSDAKLILNGLEHHLEINNPKDPKTNSAISKYPNGDLRIFSSTDGVERRELSLNVNGSAGGTKDLVISPSGNVGIANPNPAYKLDVSGIINAQGIKVNGQDLHSGVPDAEIDWYKFQNESMSDNIKAHGLGWTPSRIKVIVKEGLEGKRIYDVSYYNLTYSYEAGVNVGYGIQLSYDDQNIYLTMLNHKLCAPTKDGTYEFTDPYVKVYLWK